MVVTRDTAHLEMSLLNFDAYANAVQIITITKRRTKKIIQKQENKGKKNKNRL